MIFIMKSLMDNIFILLSSPLLIILTKLRVDQRHYSESTATPTPSPASGNVVEFRLLVSRVTYSFCLMSVALHLAALSRTVPSGTRQWSHPRRRSAIKAQRAILEASAYHLSPTPWKTWSFSPLSSHFSGVFCLFFNTWLLPGETKSDEELLTKSMEIPW